MRYQIKNKKTGEVTECATGEEYNAALKELWASGAKPDDIEAKAIVDDTPDAQPRTIRLPIAKPGARKGKRSLVAGARNSAAEIANSLGLPNAPEKKPRNRGTYFVVTDEGIIHEAKTREILADCLDETNGVSAIFYGRQVKAEKKVQYRLTGV